jgi:hypothetical protein
LALALSDFRCKRTASRDPFERNHAREFRGALRDVNQAFAAVKPFV